MCHVPRATRKRSLDSASTDPQPCTETNWDSHQTEKENVVVELEKTKAIWHQYTAKQMERVVILWLRYEIWIRQYW